MFLRAEFNMVIWEDTVKDSKLGNGKTAKDVISSWRDLLGPDLTEKFIAEAHQDIRVGFHKEKDSCKEIL